MISEKELDELLERLENPAKRGWNDHDKSAVAIRQLRERVAELKKEERVWHRLDAVLKVKS
jgi:hypothetical protein